MNNMEKNRIKKFEDFLAKDQLNERNEYALGSMDFETVENSAKSLVLFLERYYKIRINPSKIKFTPYKNEGIDINIPIQLRQFSPYEFISVIFQEMSIRLSSLRNQMDTNQLIFGCDIKYTHPSGGSNGVDLKPKRLSFDLDTEMWSTVN